MKAKILNAITAQIKMPGFFKFFFYKEDINAQLKREILTLSNWRRCFLFIFLLSYGIKMRAAFGNNHRKIWLFYFWTKVDWTYGIWWWWSSYEHSLRMELDLLLWCDDPVVKMTEHTNTQICSFSLYGKHSHMHLMEGTLFLLENWMLC